eukprot:TRINITY_DN2287_c0_g1_i5.p1 TRINITY_DN2287_c0_g1~~TRINITY_DN2287_c0_g1_i5.p1  ORF type:complete len:538 (-),score=105.84 TRINITY_DN2287_c0_g1_i5:351-1829(-)
MLAQIYNKKEGDNDERYDQLVEAISKERMQEEAKNEAFISALKDVLLETKTELQKQFEVDSQRFLEQQKEQNIDPTTESLLQKLSDLEQQNQALSQQQTNLNSKIDEIIQNQQSSKADSGSGHQTKAESEKIEEVLASVKSLLASQLSKQDVEKALVSLKNDLNQETQIDGIKQHVNRVFNVFSEQQQQARNAELTESMKTRNLILNKLQEILEQGAKKVEADIVTPVLEAFKKVEEQNNQTHKHIQQTIKQELEPIQNFNIDRQNAEEAFAQSLKKIDSKADELVKMLEKKNALEDSLVEDRSKNTSQDFPFEDRFKGIESMLQSLNQSMQSRQQKQSIPTMPISKAADFGKLVDVKIKDVCFDQSNNEYIVHFSVGSASGDYQKVLMYSQRFTEDDEKNCQSLYEYVKGGSSQTEATLYDQYVSDLAKDGFKIVRMILYNSDAVLELRKIQRNRSMLEKKKCPIVFALNISFRQDVPMFVNKDRLQLKYI